MLQIEGCTATSDKALSNILEHSRTFLLCQSSNFFSEFFFSFFPRPDHVGGAGVVYPGHGGVEASWTVGESNLKTQCLYDPDVRFNCIMLNNIKLVK